MKVIMSKTPRANLPTCRKTKVKKKLEIGDNIMAGKSIDIGTGNLISAQQSKDEKISYKIERNAFIYIGSWDQVKNKLRRTNIPYVNLDDKVYIVGTSAYDYANIFGDVELRRPMALGMLNPKEKYALPIMRELIKSLLGAPAKEKETCVYVIPSDPVDTDEHTVYHEDVVKSIIESLGYTARPIRESVALAYTGLVDENLTGCAISFGSGMANVSIMFQGLEALNFSVTKSGDYIDQHAATETDKPVPQMTAIKESPDFSLKANINNIPREHIALISYYRFVIKNILIQTAHLFNSSKGMPSFKEPIKIVCGGGTSLADGFIELFKEEFEKLEFPIKIKAFELVDDPLYAIARGALSEALLQEE